MTCKAVVNGRWMGWRGQSFKNIQLLYPDRPIFSVAENIKDSVLVILFSTIVKFPLITHIEVFLPHLCTTRTILTKIFLIFFLCPNYCIHEGPYCQ